MAQLNLLGQGLFNPPTVGSSADSFFQATNRRVDRDERSQRELLLLQR